MGVPQAKKRYTPAEYYELEEVATHKSDYYDGEIFDMAGGTATHSLITMNLGGEIREQLKGKPCRAYESNMRLKIDATGLRTYPDVSIYCEPLKFDPEDPRKTTATNPTVVFEVLSPTTESYDRRLKGLSYRKVPTLKAYAYVSQKEPAIELYLRMPNGDWALRDVMGMDATLDLECVGIAVPLAEIYAHVDFSDDDQVVDS